MKKLLSILLVLVMLLFCFTACGGGTEGEGDEGAPAIDITIAHVEPEGRSLHIGTVAFKDYVEEQSGGRITVNILPNGQYGGDAVAMEGVAQGAIQMTACVSSVLTSYEDNYMVLDLPFIFDSREAFYYALDNELGDTLLESLGNYGLVGFGFNDNGLRQMTNNVRAINSLEDFKGIKFRTMESPVFIDMFNLLGSNPVPMAWTEVYTALQQGTVDGQENGASLVYSSKLQEVQKYLSVTNHVYSCNAIIANADWYNGLDAEAQQIIKDGAIEGLINHQRDVEMNSDEEAIANLEAEGMQVNYVSEEALLDMREAVSPMYEEYKNTVDPVLFDYIDAANAAVK